MSNRALHDDKHSGGRKLTDRIGLVTLALLFIVAVSISNNVFRGMRIDLTENRLYTLSEGTVHILQSLREPVHLQLYYSATASGDMQLLRGYAERAETLMQEFAAVADGNIRVSVVDPVPFSNAEDRAQMLGLQPIQIAAEPVYLGIAGTNSTDGEERIPFLDISRERFLEYDLARLVYSLSDNRKPLIGLISSLPIAGGYNPNSGRVEPPWSILQQIGQLFDWRSLDVKDGELELPLDPDITTLLIVHPADMSATSLYAIEQFIFRGGKALVFIDPFSEASFANTPQTEPSSTFPLFRQWGLTFDPQQFVADDQFALNMTGEDDQALRHPGLLGVRSSGLNQSDVMSAGIDSLNLGFSGAFTIGKAATLSISPLVTSSRAATLLPNEIIWQTPDPSELSALIPADAEPLILAAVLNGQPESGFPATDTTHLQTPAQPISVVAVADTDLLADRYWAQAQNYFGQSIMVPIAGNADFVINILDNLSGSSDLIGMRSRATYTRPFTRVDELRRRADGAIRQRREQLESQLNETERRLEELQSENNTTDDRSRGNRQEAEIARFLAQRLQLRKELRAVQNQLNSTIEKLGTQLKMVNILLVPLLITFGGSAYTLFRRRKNLSRR